MRMRRYALLGAGLVAAVTLTACGGGTSSNGGGNNGGGGSQSSGPQKTGGTLKVTVGTPPDSLDPGFGYTTQAAEGDNMVYTPLLEYAFKEGEAGTQLIPGLAKALPTVTNNGMTYKLQMRSGLKFTDGSPIVASDFTHAVERSIRISWGGSSFFTSYIKGAADYGAKKANSISGITTNDKTGDITINLTQPYGAFANIIAFQASAPLPASTPMKVLSANPPAGFGPYKFSKVVPNAGYTLVKNPTFAAAKIPNVPTGYVDEVDVNVNSNTQSEAQSVLNNSQDIFDPADTIPSSVLPSVMSQASDRYKKFALASTYYFFLNTQVAPFNNKAARVAVNMATDRTALARLSSGQLTPACNFLPPTIVGHQDGSCSFGDPAKVPSAATVAKAKQMIKNAGLAGTKVTVWSETRSPRQEFCTYLNGLLNKLGFDSSLKVISDGVYFQTIGNRSLNAQAGFADWSQDFPNPSDFYLLLSKAGIQDTNNENFGNVDDPKIESQLKTLEAVPGTQLQSSASGWEALDTYVTNEGYTDTYGYSTSPKFTSNRVDFSQAVLNPVYYMEFNTVSLNS